MTYCWTLGFVSSYSESHDSHHLVIAAGAGSALPTTRLQDQHFGQRDHPPITVGLGIGVETEHRPCVRLAVSGDNRFFRSEFLCLLGAGGPEGDADVRTELSGLVEALFVDSKPSTPGLRC